MTMLRGSAWTASMACLLMTTALKAGGEGNPGGHAPTYFGLPGAGPSGPVYKYEHPWTYSWFGNRYTRTEETEQAKIDREYRIAMGQHVAALNRLTERREQAYLWAHPNSAVVPLGYANANYGQGFGQAENEHRMWHLMHDGPLAGHEKGGHEHCAECEKFAKSHCPKCGALGFGEHGCAKCGHGKGGHGWGDKGGWAGAPVGGGAGAPYYSAYPGMNREDALRYIEGFQYFPPYQTIRSPREFFMWDVKYGLGK